jgi:hypothetical protein
MWVYRTLLPLLATITAIAGVVAWSYSTLHPPDPERVEVAAPSPSPGPPDPQPKRTQVVPTGPENAPDGSVGVKECDEFLSRYLACISAKMPEAQAAQVRKAMDKARDAWRKAAATPSGREALAKACTQAAEAAKKAVASLGCQW